MCPLIVALKDGDLTKVNNLIAADIDVDQVDEHGVSALQFAAQHGNYEVVKALLAAGADPNLKNKNSQDNYNNIDALPLNNHNNNYDEVNNNKNLTFEQILQELQELGNISPLHIAIKLGYLNIAKLLLMYGADPNISDPGNCTPLHWAAVKGFSAGVKLLLDNNADPNIQDLAQSTALHEAVRKSNITIIRLLLSKNANPNLADIGGDTAYDLANRDPQLLETIIDSSKYLPHGWVSH